MDIVRGSFVWDSEKERLNVEKHGVYFVAAARVFADSNCRIVYDEKHGRGEHRWFAVSIVDEQIMTVRFTYRYGLIRIFGAGYWRKGREFYEKKKR